MNQNGFKSTIVGMASVLPATVLSGTELERRFGQKEMESITKMSGIRNRHVVASWQHASDLALTAAERLIKHLPFDRSLIDLLIFVSQTPDYRIPTTAAVLHGKLGLASRCASFDMNQACSAFPYVLAVAHAMLAASICRCALVLNADAITTLIHPRDRSLLALHGDAACATLIGPSGDSSGFEGFALGTDGTGAAHLMVPAGGCRQPCSPSTAVEETDSTGCVHTLEHLRMNGPAVFHFSVYKVPEVIMEALCRFGMSIDDIDTVILHQANRTMMDLIYRTLKLPMEKRFYCLEDIGNSSGPSTAVAVAEAWRRGKIQPGSRSLICSFGAGLSWGVAVIKWASNTRPIIDIDPVVPDGEVLNAAL